MEDVRSWFLSSFQFSLYLCNFGNFAKVSTITVISVLPLSRRHIAWIIWQDIGIMQFRVFSSCHLSWACLRWILRNGLHCGSRNFIAAFASCLAKNLSMRQLVNQRQRVIRFDIPASAFTYKLVSVAIVFCETATEGSHLQLHSFHSYWSTHMHLSAVMVAATRELWNLASVVRWSTRSIGFH